MGKEIERKFRVHENLITNINPSDVVSRKLIKQGYLLNTKNKVVRIRLSRDSEHGNDRAYITVKGKTQGISRQEYEYSIPIHEADEMLSMCDDVLEKIRHVVRYDYKTWEIDFFQGDNDGLIIAEIELQSEDEEFELPEWCLKEVSDNPKYYNNNLIKNPYKNWR